MCADPSRLKSFQFTPENADVARVVTFDDVKLGENRVSPDLSGQGSLMYQVTAIYYLPWSVAPPEPEPVGLMSVDVAYDRTTLAVDDVVNVSVRAKLTRPGVAKMVLLDLGIPPGFTVQADILYRHLRSAGESGPDTFIAGSWQIALTPSSARSKDHSDYGTSKTAR